MASTTAAIRKLVKDAIESAKPNFSVTDFSIAESYRPASKLTTLPAGGQVWVVGMAKDDGILTRGRAFQSEIPIQIAYQRAIADETNLTLMDKLLEFSEELRKVAKDAAADSAYAWLRNEALRDGTGFPYHFTGLRNQSTFESYFTAFFQVHEKSLTT